VRVNPASIHETLRLSHESNDRLMQLSESVQDCGHDKILLLPSRLRFGYRKQAAARSPRIALLH